MPQGSEEAPESDLRHRVGGRSRLPSEILDALIENSRRPDVLVAVVQLACAARKWDFRPDYEKEFYAELIENISPELMTDEDREQVWEVACRCLERRDRGVLDVDGIQVDLLSIWGDVVDAVGAEEYDTGISRKIEKDEAVERSRGDWVECIFEGAVLDQSWNNLGPGDEEMIDRFRSRLTDRLEDKELAHRLVEETVTRIEEQRV